MSLASKYVNDDIIVTNTLSHFGESDLSTMTPSHTIQTGSQETPKKKTSSKTNEVRVTRPFNVIDAIKRHIDPLSPHRQCQMVEEGRCEDPNFTRTSPTQDHQQQIRTVG